MRVMNPLGFSIGSSLIVPSPSAFPFSVDTTRREGLAVPGRLRAKAPSRGRIPGWRHGSTLVQNNLALACVPEGACGGVWDDHQRRFAPLCAVRIGRLHDPVAFHARL